MTTDEAIAAGRDLANQSGVGDWGTGAFFFSLIVIVVAYARSPMLPAEQVALIERDVLPVYERAFVERLRQRQIESAWIGAIIGVVLGYIILLGMAHYW